MNKEQLREIIHASAKWGVVNAYLNNTPAGEVADAIADSVLRKLEELKVSILP